jgi:hypothetical protein
MWKDPLQCGGDRGDYFQIGSVFIKRSNQTGYLKKKPKPNRNRFKPTGFYSVILNKNQFKLARLFSGLAQFFQFGSGIFWFFCLGSVRFGFFSFRLIKLKLNRTSRFFKNSNRFNRFFLWFDFFSFFSGLISFLVFFTLLT